MIIISQDVYIAIDEYTEYLINEGLASQTRANQKRAEIILAINKNLGGMFTHRPSPYKALGRNDGCRLYVYKDPKSKTQWGFAYKWFNGDNVIVYYMRNLKLINESQTR
jgi:hypothetical protein